MVCSLISPCSKNIIINPDPKEIKQTEHTSSSEDFTPSLLFHLWGGILICTCSCCLDYTFIHKPLTRSRLSSTRLPHRKQNALVSRRGWSGGWWMGVCGTAETAATLSHERSSFDLIIWEGQSAFVDEESLWYLGVGKSMRRTELWLIDPGPGIDNPCPG